MKRHIRWAALLLVLLVASVNILARVYVRRIQR